MNSERNAFAWAIPFGTWFGIQVRVNLWFFIVGLCLCLRLKDVPLAAAFTVTLFFSVLFHEFGHVIAARMTGGGGDEIHITPFGGLAMCHPARTFASRFLTAAGGLIFNVTICAITWWTVVKSEYSMRWWDPFALPGIKFAGQSVQELLPGILTLIFKANWMLLLVNLLPVHPLDGGRMTQTVLHSKLEAPIARLIYIRLGALVGCLMLVAGFALESTWVMGIGTVVLLLNMYEEFRQHVAEPEAESFMGYDFSEGYTSLERSQGEPETDAEAQPGLVERWRQQRDEDRRRRAEEEEREMERTLDALLEKLHQHGESSLSAAEKRQLQQISDRIRNRHRP